jgi:Asp-tRNA(Asn)/Glu-tRNA(Gln) amidotransferase C subunit
MLFQSCENSETEKKSKTEETSIRISGIAIDGYLSGSDVELLGEKTITDENGTWELYFPVSEKENLKESFVTIKNGIDTATGEIYEGVIRVPVTSWYSATVGTPITTIISAMMNEDKNSSSAYSDFSCLSGIPVESLYLDHMKMIQDGDPETRKIGIKIVKTALVIQKSIEIISKTIDGGSHESFLAVTDAVGNIINIQFFVCTDSNRTFEEIFTNVEYLSLEMNMTEIQKSRFENSIPQITDLIDQINSIDEDGYYSDTTENEDINFLTRLENELKMAELLAIKTEELITTNFDNPENIENYATDFTNIIAILGGVDSLGQFVSDSNASAEEFYKTVFTSEALGENIERINQLFEKENIDPLYLSEIIPTLSIMLSYNYENETFTFDQILFAKEIIEDIVGKEISMETIIEVADIMNNIKKLLLEANLEVSDWEY